MPEFLFQLTELGTVSNVDIGGLSVRTIASGPRGSWLRRVGADPSRHDPAGILIESGVITTGQVPMSGLREVFGVSVLAVWGRRGGDATDGCALQVSLDGGVTFLAWTGAAWTAQAIDGTYNSVGVLNDHLSTLELLNPRQLGFRVRLAAEEDDTPVLRGVLTALEWALDPRVDMRQLIYDRLSTLRLPFIVRSVLPAAASRITLATAMSQDLTLPVRVFNITSDPLMNVDIFDSADGDAIVFTAQQAAASVIHVELFGTPPLTVSHQDEMLRKVVVPSVDAQIGRARNLRHDVGRQYDFKKGVVTRRARARQMPRLLDYPIRIDVALAEPRTADMAVEAIRTALSNAELRSPATGILVTLIEDNPGDDVVNLTEGIDVGKWGGRFQVQVPSQVYVEYEGVREIVVDINSQGETPKIIS